MDEIVVIWARRSAVDLAHRMQALAAEWELLGATARPWETLRAVLFCDYDPRPDRPPELGDPPRELPRRIRPRVPEPGS